MHVGVWLSFGASRLRWYLALEFSCRSVLTHGFELVGCVRRPRWFDLPNPYMVSTFSGVHFFGQEGQSRTFFLTRHLLSGASGVLNLALTRAVSRLSRTKCTAA